jgi:hypothetical protein
MINIKAGIMNKQKPTDVSQFDLIQAITKHLLRSGVKAVNPRQYNTIIAAANSIVSELERPTIMATPNMGLVAWLKSDDTGLSSRYMASVLCGHPDYAEYAHPHDPDDFGRCYRFLLAVPAVRSRLNVMATKSDQWEKLCLYWDELEKLYLEESPSGKCQRLHARMHELVE